MDDWTDSDSDSGSDADSWSSRISRLEIILEETKELTRRYKEGNDAEGLNKAIAVLERAIQEEYDEPLVIDSCQTELAKLLWYRYRENRQLEDLDDAINKMEIELEEMGEKDGFGDTDSEYSAILAQMLWDRYEQSLDPNDMNDSVFRAERAAFMSSDDDSEWDDEQEEWQELLISLWSKRFHITNSLSDLDAAIEVIERVLKRVKKGDRKWMDLQQSLATNWDARAHRTNDPQDAKRAVAKARLVAERTKKKDPHWAERQAFLACALWNLSLITRNVTEGVEAISLLNSVVTKSGRGNLNNPSMAEQQAQLAVMQWLQSLLTNNVDELKDAILMLQATLSASDKGDAALESLKFDLQMMQDSLDCELQATARNQHRPALNNSSEQHREALLRAAVALQQRYNKTKRADNLNAAILLAESIVFRSANPTIEAIVSLSRMRMQLFECSNSLDALRGAISALELAINRRLKEYPRDLELSALQSRLASMLLISAEQTGDMVKLDQAIATEKSSIGLPDLSVIDRAKHRVKLSSMLKMRYQWASHKSDLDFAIHHLELAISAVPAESVDQAIFNVQMSKLLLLQYEAEGNELYLNRAIVVCEKAVQVLDKEDHESSHDARGFLAELLSRRFLVKSGRLRDLERALHIQRALITKNGTASNVIFCFSRNLCSLYELRGNLDDIETAIYRGGLARQQVQTSIAAHIEGLLKFAECLAIRFDSTGNTPDLEEAISLTQMLLSTSPKDRNLHSTVRRVLGFLLLRRYHAGRLSKDLEDAIENMAIAVAFAKIASLPLKLAYYALAESQIARYETSAKAIDKAAAIEYIQEAIASPIDANNQQIQAYNAAYRAQLAHWRYEETDLGTDLDRAISYSSEFLSFPHVERPKCARYMEFLANLLILRYSATRHIEDQRKAIKLRCAITKMAGISPVTRLRNVRQCIGLLIKRRSQGDWQKASHLVKAGIRILPDVVGRHLSHSDQETAVLSVSGFAADACSVSLQLGHKNRALQQLELGRGLMLGNMIASRTTLEELKAKRVDLADRFEALRVKAFREISEYHPRIRQRKLEQRRKAENDYRRCIEEIRHEKGFANFMADPTVEELRKEATEGPIVVVNVTDIRSDAIVVSCSRDEIQHIPLPVSIYSPETPQRMQKQVEQYRNAQGRGIGEEGSKASTDIDYLSYLWLTYVRRILEEIGCSPISNPAHQPTRRVWWIGSGVASSFKFHAAGLYEKSGWSSENTLAWCIPSYTPSIRALKYARIQEDKAGPLEKGKLNPLIVTMPTTPGEDSLDKVPLEASAVEKAIKPFCEREEVKILETPSVQDVLTQLRFCNMVHFACHGISDPGRPLQSHLLLQINGPDGPLLDRLTAEAIAKEEVSYASIAFLSACSTAQNRAEAFADESLHLNSVFQVVGFPHVIGSQWTAIDDICVDMAKLFYEYLTEAILHGYRTEAVAKALHKAMIQFQQVYWRFPRLWAPYIHTGA